jgi:hypothetical protein
MTNLYMPLDATGESVFEELVLLDILNRLDPYAHIDAVVGVVATGEVKLWKYSLNHLRFNYCDLQHPLKRGEPFWFAKLQQFYSEKGLLYLVQRLVPRDLDAPKNRFADNKEYITHYKHNIRTIEKAQENFCSFLARTKARKKNQRTCKRCFLGRTRVNAVPIIRRHRKPRPKLNKTSMLPDRYLQPKSAERRYRPRRKLHQNKQQLHWHKQHELLLLELRLRQLLLGLLVPLLAWQVLTVCQRW